MALSFGVLASGTMVSTDVFAQAVSVNGGSIQGTITDASGAVVPQAKIVVVSTETGFTKTLTSDSAGYYSIGPLNPGPYTVTVTAAGFSTLQVTTSIRTGTVTSGNFKVSLGAASDTVEVDAGAVQINTDQIGVSGIVSREQIDSLPINGRNILDIAQLQPGVILQPGDSFDPTKSGYSALSVGGVSGRTTRILLDGQDITDETVGTTLFNVPEGAIDEFQLNRSTQDVSGEVTSTGQVLMPTRTGTNGIHGNLFYIFQDARVGFATVDSTAVPFQRNQFGGYVGGPIIRDKLFFFGGSERLKQDAENAAGANIFFSNIVDQYKEVPNPFRDTFSIGRLDYNGFHGIHLFARAISSNNAADGTSGYNPYSVFKNQDNVPSIVGGADFTTGKFTHSFRYGYEKFENGITDGTAALGSSIYNPSSILGFQITLDGSLDAGQNLLAPQNTFQSDKQFRYDGTWTKAAHTVKFGAEMNRILNGGDAPFFGGSVFTVFDANSSSFVLSQCANPAEGTGPCPGDPLYGYSAEEFVIGNGNGLFSERPGFGRPGGGDPSWRFAAYVADTWKVKPFFTVQGGLRWSVDTDRANQDLPTPLCSQVDHSLQFPGCTGNTPLFDQYGPGLGLGQKTHQPYANFGPQLGFVFSPGSHKLAIRGGSGIFFESNIFNNTGNARTPEITAQGQYFNNGAAVYYSPTIALPGFPTVMGLLASGTPCTPAANNPACITIPQLFTESIAQSAATINGLKTLYDASAKQPGPNPSFIGKGGGLSASNIYAGPYKSPYSIQLNGGVQYELSKGLIVSADFVHNATLKVPTTVDTNHVGAARFLNVAAAQNAIATTLANCGAASIDAAIMPGGCTGGSGVDPVTGLANNSALIDDFANNGLNSGIDYLGGYAASADGLSPATGAAFAGANPNVGQGKFILPVGKSGYDALQIVVQEQKAHPLPYINSSNFQISYNLSRVTTTSSSSDQFFGGNGAYNQDHVTQYMGRNSLDHTNQLSLGGSIGIKYGLQVGAIAHFYSAPPSTLTLPTTSGPGQIFKTDVDGDGTEGDLVPGTNPGAYMHAIKGSGLNQLITTYNNQYAGQLTPAGQALVSAGLFTATELSKLNAVQQPLASAPTNPIGNAAFRSFDLDFSYPIHLTKYREGLSITPGVALYNVANMTNFGAFGGLATLADAAYSAGELNGANKPFNYYPARVGRGTGTFDAGGPRSMEFNLKVNF
jgi:hypothetical protein